MLCFQSLDVKNYLTQVVNWTAIMNNGNDMFVTFKTLLDTLDPLMTSMGHVGLQEAWKTISNVMISMYNVSSFNDTIG